jgi:hypothetical protein
MSHGSGPSCHLQQDLEEGVARRGGDEGPATDQIVVHRAFITAPVIHPRGGAMGSRGARRCPSRRAPLPSPALAWVSLSGLVSSLTRTRRRSPGSGGQVGARQRRRLSLVQHDGRDRSPQGVTRSPLHASARAKTGPVPTTGVIAAPKASDRAGREQRSGGDRAAACRRTSKRSP